MELERFTISWCGQDELREAREFKQRAGYRGLNALLKQLIRSWLEAQREQEQHTEPMR